MPLVMLNGVALMQRKLVQGFSVPSIGMVCVFGVAFAACSTKAETSATPGTGDLVPVVVALGPGGRTAVSCDGGRRFRVNGFHKTPDDDHSPNAVTGLAGGKGAVIASAGWGAPGRLFYSDNAVDWQELPSSAYEDSSGVVGAKMDSTSGVFFDGDVFKLLWAQNLWVSSDGKTWDQSDMEIPDVAAVRNVEFYAKDKLLLMRVDRLEDGKFEPFVVTSKDLGQSYEIWSPKTTGCPDFQWGPVAQSHGVLIVGGSAGAVCRSQDGGRSWAPVADLTNVDATFADDRAVFAAHGDELLRSEDGKVWTRVLKANGIFSVGVWSPATGYVVSADRGGQLQFFRSDDGLTWEPSESVTGTSFQPRFMQTALVKPSANCPRG